MAEAVLDIKPPALAFELRHRVVDKTRPVAAAIDKGKRGSTPVHRAGVKGFDRAQPESLQPILCRPLGGRVAAANHDAAVLDLALLARRVVATDHGVAIGEGEQGDVDPLLPILAPNLPIVAAARPIGERQCRNRRVVPDLLDEVGPWRRQHEVRQIAFEQCAQCGRLRGSHRRRRQGDPDQGPRDVESYWTNQVRSRVDIPG